MTTRILQEESERIMIITDAFIFAGKNNKNTIELFLIRFTDEGNRYMASIKTHIAKNKKYLNLLKLSVFQNDEDISLKTIDKYSVEFKDVEKKFKEHLNSNNGCLFEENPSHAESIVRNVVRLKSEMIYSAYYDSKKLLMYIEFYSSEVYMYTTDIYIYKDMDFKVYNELLEAESPGRFFNFNIRDRYEFCRYGCFTDETLW